MRVISLFNSRSVTRSFILFRYLVDVAATRFIYDHAAPPYLIGGCRLRRPFSYLVDLAVRVRSAPNLCGSVGQPAGLEPRNGGSA